MAEISKLNEQVYSDHDVLAHLNHTLTVLHRIGGYAFLNEEDKQVLQYAHDCLQSIRNAHIEALKEVAKETPAMIVSARKGDTVKATSGLMFRGKKR